MKSHKTFRSGILPVLLVPALLAGLMPARAGAATLVVTTTADPGVGGCTASGNGDGCTLCEAITAANNQTLTPGADTINATGISGVITLATALPPLSTNIILNGPGAANLTVRRSSTAGTPEFRIFTIDNTTTSGPTVTLSGLTITGGKVSGSDAQTNSGGGIYNNHGILTVSNTVLRSNSATNGGAICNDGSLSDNATLRLSNSTLTENTATGGGGGLFNNGSGGGSAPLVISNCVFTSNSATNGGAILNDGHAGGSATITELSNSVLSANTASANGGAIKNNGITGGSATLVISDTTVSANTAANGGGIDNAGTAGSATQAISTSTFNANTAAANGGAINNEGRTAGSATLTVGTSTFFANTAGAKGGAILNDGRNAGSGTVEIDNSTLKSNTASMTSAAIDSDGTGGSATLALGSTILANGPSANLTLTVNSETTFTSKNYNLSSDPAGATGASAGTTGPGGPYLTEGGDRRNTDPKLDPRGLRDNGGPTQTIALLSGSPAIDQGISSFSTDQRGFPRPIDNPAISNAADGSDIGAYEGEVAVASPVNVSLMPANSSRVAGVSNTYTSKYSDPNGIPDIAEARILINSTLNGANGLHALYLVNSNRLYLRDNTNGAWLGGFAPLSDNVITNSQGSLNCALTTVSGAGNTLTVNWSFTPASTFMGGKYIYMLVRDKANLMDGWEQMGTVQIVANKAPLNQSVTPNSGSSAAGTARTLTAKYFDENGATDIGEARLLVNSAATGANGLMGMYFVSSNKLYLRDNTNGSWLGGFEPGSNNTISNSQGSLNCAVTTVTFGAQILTINWSFTPVLSFTGTKNLYLLVRDRSNAADGLEQFGTWTITGSATTSSTARSTSQTSSVALSSATARVSSQSVLLTFTGALDATVASDPARYEVQINGAVVESATYNAATNSVTLSLASGTLQTGDRLVVCWQELRDKNGMALSGCSDTLTAR